MANSTLSARQWIHPDEIETSGDLPIIGGGDVTRGIYLLVYRAREPIERSIGALGNHALDTGMYFYIGSAFGTGGFSRIQRHISVADSDRGVSHWHIDYIAQSSAIQLIDILVVPKWDGECALASALHTSPDCATPVTKFGATDCQCKAHFIQQVSSDVSHREVVDARIQRIL